MQNTLILTCKQCKKISLRYCTFAFSYCLWIPDNTSQLSPASPRMPDSPSTASGCLIWQCRSRTATPSVAWGASGIYSTCRISGPNLDRISLFTRSLGNGYVRGSLRSWLLLKAPRPADSPERDRAGREPGGAAFSGSFCCAISTDPHCVPLSPFSWAEKISTAWTGEMQKAQGIRRRFLGNRTRDANEKKKEEKTWS